MLRVKEIASPRYEIRPTKIESKMSPKNYCSKLASQQLVSVDIKNMKSPTSKLYSNLYSMTIQTERPTLELNTKVIESKMKGKRIRTAE